MAIDRGPWNALIDDDGSGLVGTVWNKDKIKTVILDPADLAYGPLPVAGTWTPTDQSGAGLTFTTAVGTYVKIGPLVTLSLHLIYPTNSNVAPAIVSLPFTASSQAGFYQSYGAVFLRTWTNAGTARINLYDGATGVAKSNQNLTGQNFVLHGTYFV